MSLKSIGSTSFYNKTQVFFGFSRKTGIVFSVFGRSDNTSCLYIFKIQSIFQ
ncbi:hypothetical protein Hanom_Chr04g00341141 [Helianthus anomalus]